MCFRQYASIYTYNPYIITLRGISVICSSISILLLLPSQPWINHYTYIHEGILVQSNRHITSINLESYRTIRHQQRTRKANILQWRTALYCQIIWFQNTSPLCYMDIIWSLSDFIGILATVTPTYGIAMELDFIANCFSHPHC